MKVYIFLLFELDGEVYSGTFSSIDKLMTRIKQRYGLNLEYDPINKVVRVVGDIWGFGRVEEDTLDEEEK